MPAPPKNFGRTLKVGQPTEPLEQILSSGKSVLENLHQPDTRIGPILKPKDV